MRKILIIAGAALAAALVLAGCNKQPASPMPPELSKISVSQEKIGVGQQIVLTAHDVVSASGDLYQTQAFWKINGNQVLDDFAHVHTQGGLNEYLCYYTPSKAGVLDVELEVIMYFNNAPEGEMEKRVTATTELDVLNCDARNSFWGDSVEVTLQREPGLSPTPTSDGIYSGEGESSILGMSAYAKTVRLEYQFEKEKLIGITESFSVAPSTNSSAMFGINQSERYMASITVQISPETLINRKSVCFHTAVNTVSTTNDMGIPYIYAIQPYRNHGAAMVSTVLTSVATSHTIAKDKHVMIIRIPRTGGSFAGAFSLTISLSVTPKISAISQSTATSGIPSPRSHLDTALSE